MDSGRNSEFEREGGRKDKNNGNPPQFAFSMSTNSEVHLRVQASSSSSTMNRTASAPARRSFRRFNTAGPFLGFDEDDEKEVDASEENVVPELEPRPFFRLDLDKNFFPSGIESGHVVEIKGPENCGKTFLLTHFISQVLRNYHQKKVVLIDTSHQFSLRNLICMLSRDTFFSVSGKCHQTTSQIVQTTPELTQFLDRLIIFNCYNVEEFMVTVGLNETSALEGILRRHLDVALIAVDTLDCYSFTHSLADGKEYNVSESLRKHSARIPIIYTTIHIASAFQLVTQSHPSASEDNGRHANNANCLYNVVVQPDFSTHRLSILPYKLLTNERLKDEGKYVGVARLVSNANVSAFTTTLTHEVKFCIQSDNVFVKKEVVVPTC